MNKKISVVILNWNGKKHLELFLPSVVKHTQHKDVKIVIADNGSSDDSVDFIEKNYPNIQLILLDKNYGFAGGYNKALAEIDSEYYILLNSDVEVTANWIIPAINVMDNQRDIAALQPKILSYMNKERFEYAGASGGYIDKYGYPFCKGRIFDTLETDKGQYNESEDIFWASGACLFIRSSYFHEVGGFDESFFAHMEEIDLCWRLQLSNYRISYCPIVKVYHLGGGSLPKSSPYKTYLNIRNNKSMLYKNLPKKGRKKILSIRFLLDMIAAVKFLSGKNGWNEFISVIKAHRDYLKMKPDLKEKRKELNIKPVGNIYKRNIVWDYYALNKNKFSELSKKDFL